MSKLFLDLMACRCVYKIFFLITRLERLRESVYDGTILITGRTGTGKELVADEIQRNSGRFGPYTKVNCAALPESLAEAEFFGYKKGAFTGADEDKKGIFADSDRGIVLLDEIGELPFEVQGKLLRVLENGEVRALGSLYPVTVDVRVLSSTNRDLRRLVTEGKFREDLFYRLNIFEIHLPDLAERLDDVGFLAYHFLDELNRRYVGDKRFAPEALFVLRQYDWPGNVRELKHCLERAYLFSQATDISPEDIVQANGKAPNTTPPANGNGRIETLKEVEIAHISRAMDEIIVRRGGNLREVVFALGIGRRTLYDKLKRYGLHEIYADVLKVRKGRRSKFTR